MKIRPVEAELFFADGETGRHTGIRTDRHDEDKNRFSQFYEKRLQMCQSYVQSA